MRLNKITAMILSAVIGTTCFVMPFGENLPKWELKQIEVNAEENLTVKEICLGYGYSATVTEDGSLYMWGKNSDGQLGNRKKTDSSTPIKVMDNVVTISLGSSHSAAITEDGSLYMWGNNYHGQLGDGTTTDSAIPIKVMDNVSAVSLNGFHSAAITKDGSLYMWGENGFGQLGNGTKTNSSTPIKVMDNVTAISLGYYHSAAITEDGSLYMWGNNWYGQLGNGVSAENIFSDDEANSDIPIKVLDNVQAVSLGLGHSAAITKDGSLYMWGLNTYGQLGNGISGGVNGGYNDGIDSNIPIKIMDNVASISLGYDHSAAITEDGILYMWGQNGTGQLGNGTTTDCSTPIKVMENVAAISLSEYHSSAITKGHRLYMWGDNFYGQLGNGNSDNNGYYSTYDEGVDSNIPIILDFFGGEDYSSNNPNPSPVTNLYDGPSLEDVKAIQAFLLNADYVGSGRVIDVDENGVVDCFDLALAKRMLLRSGAPSLVDFSADVYDIYLDTEKTVLFTVEVTEISPLAPNAIALYDDENAFVSYMHDDGKNGDATANDGIYSAQVVLSSDEIEVVGYYAATEQVQSETFEICFYRDLTEEEYDGFQEFQQSISSLTFTEACELIKESDKVLSYTIDEDSHTIFYRSVYYIYGIWEEPGNGEISGTGHYAIEDSKIENWTKNSTSYEKYINDWCSALDDVISDAQIVTRYDQVLVDTLDTEKRDVIVLRPFRNTGYDSQHPYDDLNKLGQIIADAMGGKLTVIDDYDVTLGQLKQLSTYGVVLIETHGGMFNGQPYISTGSIGNMLNFMLYSPDYIRGSIAENTFKQTDANGNVTRSETRISVNAAFFKKHYGKDALKDSIWYLAACHGLQDDSFPDALISRGAEGVVGYNETVHWVYTFMTAAEIFGNSAILSADTIKKGVMEANRIFGLDEVEEKDNNGNTHTIFASVRYKGKVNFRLVSSIEQYGILSGLIFDAEHSSAALANTRVEVYQNDKRRWYYETEQFGGYNVSLPIGTYKLKITKDGYRSIEREIEIKLNQVTNIETYLEKESDGIISGKVCKASDRSTPISTAKISAYQENKLIKSVTCDSNGNYSLNVPEGSYQIRITASGYISFDNFVDVVPDETTYLETFLLVENSSESEGTASGQIINALTGSGLDNVTLTIRNGWNNKNSGTVIKTIKTDSTGKYSVSLPLGNYTLYAEKEGYISGVVNIVVNPGETDSQNGSITPVIDGSNFRIVLTWGENPRDLDSHLNGADSSGNRFDVYYSSKTKSENGTTICNLDVDDTSSYGPETTTLHVISTEPYYYYVHHFAGSGSLSTSEAQVKVYQGDILLTTYNVPTDQGTDAYWNVFAIINGKIIAKNTITSSADTSYTK